MPLSEHEQRILDEMERALRGEPDISVVSAPHTSAPAPGRARRYTIAIIGTVVGLVLVVLGAAKSNVPLGVAGFVVMLAAMIYGFGRPNSPADSSSDQGEFNAESPRAGAGNAKKSATERIQERWDRRMRGEI